jgi:hypothetical protein
VRIQDLRTGVTCNKGQEEEGQVTSGAGGVGNLSLQLLMEQWAGGVGGGESREDTDTEFCSAERVANTHS